jgi:hypothetical protein
VVEDDEEHADAAEEDGELVELVVGDHCVWCLCELEGGLVSFGTGWVGKLSGRAELTVVVGEERSQELRS